MSSGISKVDMVCATCGGEVKAGLTRVAWSGRSDNKMPDGSAKKSHVECYFTKPNIPVKMRDADGRYIDGTPNPVPDAPKVEPKQRCNESFVWYDATGKEIVRCLLDEPHGGPHVANYHGLLVRSDGTVKTPEPKPEPKPVKPAASNGNGSKDAGIVSLIATEVLAMIKDDISTKVDETQVAAIAEGIVNTQVAFAVQAALENHTRTIVINDVATGELKKLDGLQHKQFATLLKMIQTCKRTKSNVMIVDKKGKGGPGAGKTYAAGEVAKALGARLYGHISLNVQSQPSMIMGYNDAQGRYVSTVFRDIYENGGVFLFDEVFAANGNFLTSLNTGLANGSMAFPDKIVPRHDDAVFIGCDNTNGMGANSMHSTRQVADTAFRERFVFLEWEYDEKLERKVSLAYNDNADEWVSWVQKVRQSVSSLGIKLVVSPRASIQGSAFLKDGFGVEETADMTLFKAIDADTRSKVLANVAFPKYN